eukprot:423567-Alexandrium_andersonii.AAC.1
MAAASEDSQTGQPDVQEPPLDGAASAAPDGGVEAPADAPEDAPEDAAAAGGKVEGASATPGVSSP